MIEAQKHIVSQANGSDFFEVKWQTQIKEALTPDQWHEIDKYIEAKIEQWNKR